MNNLIKYLFFIGLIIATGCGEADDSKNQKQASAEKTGSKNDSQSGESDGIVGEWRQILITSDENGNGQIEPEERAKGSAIDDYLKLNSDGSAVWHIFETKGTYKIKTNESSGKQYLYLYDHANNEYSKGSIHSVTKDELILIHKLGGDSYTIWKRQ